MKPEKTGTELTPQITKAIGPRRVGGEYVSDYWGIRYRVDAIYTGEAARPHIRYSDWAIIVTDLDGQNAGRSRTHCTPWDRLDKVIRQPSPSPGVVGASCA
jgi:hypothetical protein